MHEIGIANSILDVVRVEAQLRPGAVPCKIVVRIGEMVAVDPDALRFCFEALTRETGLEELQLEIELCPRRHLCLSCNAEFQVYEFDSTCPWCLNDRTQCISGEELEIAHLEMEEYEPSAA
jgi:hydrogenase nickel incorporation protein HypA/HybF